MSACHLEFCVEFTYESDYTGRKHGHPCYELVYYLQGSGTIDINGNTFIFGPGTFSIAGPHEFHREIGVRNTRVIYIGFTVPEDTILESGVYHDEYFGILTLMKEINREMQADHTHKGKIMDLLTGAIVYKIDQRLNFFQNDGRSEWDYIKNYIKNNCMKPLSVRTLAEKVGYSYDYFRHLFLKQFGISVKTYIIEERIKYAKDLFVKTQYSIKEIAYLSGFTSPSHFSKSFKQVTGMTPSDFMAPLNRSNKLSEIIYLDDESVLFVETKTKE